MRVVVGEHSVFRQRWVIHAFKDGKILPLFPKYFPEPYDSELEMLQAVRDRLDTDVAFATRWYGWMMLPVNFNKAIIVKTIPKVREAS